MEKNIIIDVNEVLFKERTKGKIRSLLIYCSILPILSLYNLISQYNPVPFILLSLFFYGSAFFTIRTIKKEASKSIIKLYELDGKIWIEYLDHDKEESPIIIDLNNFKFKFTRTYQRGYTSRLKLDLFDGETQVFRQYLYGKWYPQMMIRVYKELKKLKNESFSVNELKIINDQEFK